jgi:hypothetical protein
MTSFAQRVAQLTGIEIAILTSPHVLGKGPALVLRPRGTNWLMW